ncbi:MAG: M50 family metallopeptidase [Gorillibacterium sp.]|nr:M50 family metallopeptidase [Gorillibacterium sp.]
MVLSVVTGYFIELLTLFGIVLIHELGHVAAARSFGWRVPEVKLLPFGGVAVTDEGGSVPAREELLVALAGPLQNAMMIGFAFLMIRVGGMDVEWWSYFIKANLLIGAFNLLPIHPLDGGRVLLCLLGYGMSYHRALVACTRISLVMSILLVLGSILPQLSSGLNLNVLAVGLFLFYTNYYGYKQIPFSFLRFLMGWEASAARFLKEGASLERLYVRSSLSLSETSQMLMRGKYHLIYICSSEGKVNLVVPEQAFIRAFFSGQKTDRAVSEVFL